MPQALLLRLRARSDVTCRPLSAFLINILGVIECVPCCLGAQMCLFFEEVVQICTHFKLQLL
jgi:hypothetical protein